MAGPTGLEPATSGVTGRKVVRKRNKNAELSRGFCCHSWVAVGGLGWVPVARGHVFGHVSQVCSRQGVHRAGEHGRPGGCRKTTRPRQRQNHDDLRQGHQGGQGPGCRRPGEGISELATESCIWCELASTTPRKSRSSAAKRCESLTTFSRPPSSLPPRGPDDSLRDLGPICIVVARIARPRDP